MEAETYLLRCQRYIELNPVRAGMVADPAEYRCLTFGRIALCRDQGKSMASGVLELRKRGRPSKAAGEGAEDRSGQGELSL